MATRFEELEPKYMFEELGYVLDDCSDFLGDACCLNYQIIKDNCIKKEITFYLKGAGLQEDQFYIGFSDVNYLTKKELKAIKKQIEELGWLEDK